MGRGRAARAAASLYLYLAEVLTTAASLSDNRASPPGLRQCIMQGHAEKYTQQDLQHVWCDLFQCTPMKTGHDRQSAPSVNPHALTARLAHLTCIEPMPAMGAPSWRETLLASPGAAWPSASRHRQAVPGGGPWQCSGARVLCSRWPECC